MIVDPKDITIVGETNFRTMRKKFGIKRDDRRRHVYVIGKSGSGKSVLLENMIMQDVMNGNGCCVMDPHGDLAEAIVKCVPPERQNDIVYFNPSDVDFPIAFNILEGAGSDSSKNLVTSGLIGIFKKIWADSWGPRLEYVLRNTILSLMYADGSTLLGINRMLVDKKYRNSVLENVHDPILKAFWTQEYENYPAKELPMIISPIQNKVGQFLSNPIVRNILGQAHSTLDLREIMDKKKIFLVNLSKGRIGEDNSSLIGSMIVTKLYLAAMSRVDTAEQERSDFYLYVDEFQNFATDSFADILSEARKYRLALIIAHQYVLQLPEKVADAIFGNGGTLITFRLGPQDAEIFEKEFGPDFLLEDLVNIPKYNVILKLLIDGVASRPFSAATLPPATKNGNFQDRSAEIIAESRKRYARTREFVEQQIIDWSMTDDERRAIEKIKKAEEAKKLALENGVPIESVGNKMYSTNCWVCGMKMDVPFAPDDKRPIYCLDDLKKIREKLIEEPSENRFKVVKVDNIDDGKEAVRKNENESRNDDNKSQDNRNRDGRDQKKDGRNGSDNKRQENNSQKKNSNGNKENQNKSQQNNNGNNQKKDENRNRDQKQNQNNNGNKDNNSKNQGNNNNSNKINEGRKNIVESEVMRLDEVKKEEDKIDGQNVIEKIEPVSENIKIEPITEELKIEAHEVVKSIEQVEDRTHIEPTKEEVKIEEPKISEESKNIEITEEEREGHINNFKSMLGDIMQEVGIDKSKLVIEIGKNSEVEKEDKKIEPVKEEIKIEEPEEIVQYPPSPEATADKEEKSQEVIEKPTLSLDKLKEMSFEDLKKELNNENSQSNKPNVLQAGQVIKF